MRSWLLTILRRRVQYFCGKCNYSAGTPGKCPLCKGTLQRIDI